MEPHFGGESMKLAIGILLLLAGCASLTRNPSATSTFDIRAYGAKPDGETSCTKSIQKAIDACAAAGGGTVIVPAGRYVTGTLWLRSNINLHLTAGATLLGSQSMDDFPQWISKWEGDKVPIRRAPLICGEDLENVSLSGQGTIDARGEMWWKLQRAQPGVEVLRPLMFRVVNCRYVSITGLTFRNSPMWTISPLACDNVTIRGITIQNPADAPNTDGINPDSCSNVRISDCQVDVGDDCITIKSGKEDDGRRELKACENITVTNCTLLHGHGGVVIGSEMSGSVRNVVISNCVFVGTDRGLRFKGRRGRGGVVEDVRASNIIMDGVLCPISVNLFYAPGARGEKKVTEMTPFPVDAGTPRFRRIHLSNITARRVKYCAAYLLGLPEMHVDDFSCENVTFYLDPENKTAGRADIAPDTPKLCRAGFVARWVDHLSLRNVTIVDQLGPAVAVSDAADLAISDLTMHAVPADGPAVILAEVRGGSLHNLSGDGTAPLRIQTAGAAASSIRIGNAEEASRYTIEK